MPIMVQTSDLKDFSGPMTHIYQEKSLKQNQMECMKVQLPGEQLDAVV